MNRYVQRATQRARMLLTDNIQSGAAVVSTITSFNSENLAAKGKALWPTSYKCVARTYIHSS